MNPSLHKCTGQAGHGRAILLGKDDSCESLWPSAVHELFIYVQSACAAIILLFHALPVLYIDRLIIAYTQSELGTRQYCCNNVPVFSGHDCTDEISIFRCV